MKNEKYTHLLSWGADLEDMQLISKYNKWCLFLLCIIIVLVNMNNCSFKGQKGNKVTDAFQKVFNEPGRKPNKIWLNKSSEFYNRSTKS